MKSAILPNTLVTSVRSSDVWKSVELAEMVAIDDTTALTLETVSSVTWATNNPGMVFKAF